MTTASALDRRVRIPAEWEPHACCWMAWALRPGWGSALTKVKRELSEVIRTIAQYEPVRVLALRGTRLREARCEFAGCTNIDVVEAPIDDIWMRGIAPTFAIRGSGADRELVAIDWNFNGWGGTEKVVRGDKCAADVIADVAGIPRLRANFNAEGGALIFDGHRTVITTRSCLLNPNRNPVIQGGDRQISIEVDLRRFGIDNVIWLEGDTSEPITSGHVDGYVLVGSAGTILVEHTDDPGVEGPMWRDQYRGVASCGAGNRREIRGHTGCRSAIPLLEEEIRVIRSCLSECVCRQWCSDRC